MLITVLQVLADGDLLSIIKHVLMWINVFDCITFYLNDWCTL